MTETVLDDTQQAIIRQRLLDSLQDTRTELEQAIELLRSKGKDDWDIDEPMIGGEEWEMVLARQPILQARIEDLQDALDRLNNGTYGFCEECGQPIPWERLEIIPETRHCVRCEAALKEEA